jgi:hypothetical protein
MQPVMMTTTRFNNGQVERGNITLQDHSNPHCTTELTLWGHFALELEQEAAIGELWCFREVKVQVFKNQRTFGTTSKTEFFVAPFENLHSGGGGGGGPPAGPAGMHALPPPASYIPGAPLQAETAGQTGPAGEYVPLAPPPTMLLSLDESTPKDPFCLCRIAEIKLPLFYVACTKCGRKTDQSGHCQRCNTNESELRFLIRMLLSDGVSQLRATGFTAMGETLFEMTTAEFVHCQSLEQSYSQRMVQCLAGVPILVKLSKGEGDAHVVDLQHVDLDDLVGDMFDALVVM